MKVIVMSDSHGCDENLDAVIAENSDADYFLHCGDLCSDERKYRDVIFVLGNNDWGADFPRYRVLHLNGVGIYMTHSDRCYGNREELLATQAKFYGCEICLFGHTHCTVNHRYKGVQLINPGSLFYNRDGSDVGYVEIVINEDSSFEITRKLLKTSSKLI